ncbi:rRNA maturation RNase YbeY [Brachyspira innocens]|uniref:Endoribonuclease YbeY n=1 Tax=Brachyspira innocens TaxID=13264 RepID=A0ABT8YUH2_9SPIR|nr:rRNA maturation RNase YbeY [Brachyspira innocens]MDO6993937.1 rRNA maturation RNase YbeY [Brachyspira innocens]MDO7019523.1 rRNA maturation RNase YbeY [Brachyspira innocens]
MKVNVFNETDYDINIKYYKYFLYNSLIVSGINGDVNLLFCDDEYIKKLNNDFRNKDKATDVLTFPMGDADEGGDIVISYEWVKNRYSEDKIKKTVLKLIIHSILHLKGIHHNYSKKSLMENNEKMKELYYKVIKYIKDNRKKHNF